MSQPEDTLPNTNTNQSGASNTPEHKPEAKQPNTITVSANGQATTPSEQPTQSESVNDKASKSEAKSNHSPKEPNKMTEPNSSQDKAATDKTPTQQPVIVKQSSGKGLAVGALVLALLGLGASGLLFVQGQNVLKTQELNFSQKMDKAALGESQNAAVLQENQRKQAELADAFAGLETAQKTNADNIAKAQAAYQELIKGRANWLVDEAEVTLNLAAQQLMLSGNVPLAVSVLESIENRLNRFDYPDLLPIKQALSQDLATLKNRSYIDIGSASLRLDRLQTAVAGLPLTVDATLRPSETATQTTEPDSTLSWWEQTWQRTLNSLKGMVEVRKINSGDAMLISPEQTYFVRENLRLRLMDARLALLQRQGEIFQSDLNNAEAAVKQYFDPKSPAVQSWLKELSALKSIEVAGISGDEVLKNSLLAVRTYQNAVQNAQASTLPDLSASDAATTEPTAQAASTPSENTNNTVNTPAASASEPATPAEPTAASAPAQEASAPSGNAVKGERA